jgi:16S rRNA (guanine1516-N2)-methyltransferase
LSTRLIVTTVTKQSPIWKQQALKLAEELGGKFIERNETVRKIQQTYNTEKVLVVGETVTLFIGDQRVFFHPSMAMVRVKRMILGETDLMVELSRVQPGDQVLDCTFGFGSDSIVYSYAVGNEGSVTGIEANPLLAVLVREGLKNWETESKVLNEAMRRIRVMAGEHLEYMRLLPDKSVDVVYFDPMFRSPVKDSVSMDPLRVLSNTDPLSVEAIREACRISRKSVVLKERPESGEFERLGFPSPHRRTSSFTYSVINLMEVEPH